MISWLPSFSHTLTQTFLITPVWELSWDTKEFSCFCPAGRFGRYHGDRRSKGPEFVLSKEGGFMVPLPVFVPPFMRLFFLPQASSALLLWFIKCSKRCFDGSKQVRPWPISFRCRAWSDLTVIFTVLFCFVLLHQETPHTSTSSENFPTWHPTTQRSWSEGVCISDTPSGSPTSSWRGSKNTYLNPSIYIYIVPAGGVASLKFKPLWGA